MQRGQSQRVGASAVPGREQRNADAATIHTRSVRGAGTTFAGQRHEHEAQLRHKRTYPGHKRRAGRVRD